MILFPCISQIIQPRAVLGDPIREDCLKIFWSFRKQGFILAGWADCQGKTISPAENVHCLLLKMKLSIMYFLNLEDPCKFWMLNTKLLGFFHPSSLVDTFGDWTNCNTLCLVENLGCCIFYRGRSYKKQEVQNYWKKYKQMQKDLLKST